MPLSLRGRKGLRALQAVDVHQPHCLKAAQSISADTVKPSFVELTALREVHDVDVIAHPRAIGGVVVAAEDGEALAAAFIVWWVERVARSSSEFARVRYEEQCTLVIIRP